MDCIRISVGLTILILLLSRIAAGNTVKPSGSVKEEYRTNSSNIVLDSERKRPLLVCGKALTETDDV